MAKNAYIRKKSKKDGIVFTLGEFLEDMKQKRYDPETIKNYEGRLKQFLQYLDRNNISRLQDVVPAEIESLRLELVRRKLSAATVDSHLRTLKVFFRYLEREGIIFSSPTADLVMPRPKTENKFIPSLNEMKKFLAVPDVGTDTGLRDRAVIETAYSTGIRRCELHGLKMTDPDFREGTLNIAKGKGGKARVVPLGGPACFWLDKYISTSRKSLLAGNDDETALWISKKHRKLTIAALDEIFSRRSEKTGRKISSHAVRRACVNHMLNNGAHPVHLQELLGHSRIGTLRHYLRTSISDLKKTHSGTGVGE